MPSTIQSGSLPALIEPKPRTRIEGVVPRSPDVLEVCTPATRPISAVATLEVCTLAISSDFMTAAEPVKASFLAVPKATTITSSIACASSFIVTLIRVFPAIGNCCGSKPTNVTTSVPFAGAESVYSPAVLVVVPREVPSTMTVAPATGCPFASETVPEICLFWAVAYAKNTNTAINDSTIFLTISVNFN